LTRRRRTALRIVATVLLALAALSLVVAWRAPEPAAAAPRTPNFTTVSTPLASARRIPYVFTDALARVRLASTVSEQVAPYNACLVVDDPREPGAHMASVQPDLALAPASVLKLPTAVAALAALGADHAFSTRALLGSDGNLYLVGGGDPVLATPAYEQLIRSAALTRTDPVTSLAALADAIVASGVRSVPAIVTDDSRHDSLRFLPDWKPGYTDEIGALGALTVNDGAAPDGQRAADPALNAGAHLQALLAERCVAVGAVTGGRAPAEGAREVGVVTSAPLGDIAAAMIRSSDNDTAEMLTREIGVARSGDGSTGAGVQGIRDVLVELGASTDGLDLKDGSGLSAANRITCETVIDTIALVDDERFAAVDEGLPVAGQTGTLAGRLRGDPLGGVLRAKTGYIDGVAGLAGIVDDDEHLRFAFLANDTFSQTDGRALADQVARLIGAYPAVPAPGEVVPAP
jgi:serine-type D-Ala-D-Ala carboxypeptidase/endopeptidase (penicillin-binding protein 4)